MRPVKKILILSANPKDSNRLRLDEEVREIEEGLMRAKNRGNFVIEAKWAVRLRDLRRALLDFEPQIVHFTGHGRMSGLILEDEMGIGVAISTKALSGLFKLFSKRIECVILSSCYSASQANAIIKHVDYVIGLRSEIKDTAAIEFALGFYDAIGAGKNVEEAFEFGCNATQQVYPDIPAHLIPILKKKSIDFLISKIPVPLLKAARRFFDIIGAKVTVDSSSPFLRIESIPGNLQPYLPIQVLVVDDEPTDRNVTELVRQAKKNRKDRRDYAGILLYREPPNALCRMKMAEVRLREDFILIPLPLIAVEKALLDRNNCLGLLAEYTNRYLPGADLFDDRNAIGDTFSFFGRLELLHRLGEELKKNQSIGLFGLRKSGKTSILLQLNFVLRRHPVVYIDLQLYGGKSLYGAEIFNNMIQQLTYLVQIKEIVDEEFFFDNTNVKSFPINSPAKELTAVFSKQINELAQLLQERGYDLPIICLLDEVERIIPFNEDSKRKVEEFNAFFGVLRALSQKSRNLSLLVADVHTDFNRINQWTQPGVPTNPVFHFFKEVFIAPFLEEDTTTMLTDIGKLMTRAFDKKTLSEIHIKSGGHPFVARQLASLLCKKIPIEVAQCIKWENSQYYLENPLLDSDSLIDYIDGNIWGDLSKRNFEPEIHVLRSLASSSKGLTRSTLFSYLNDHYSQNNIVKALIWLEAVGLVERKKELYNIRMPLLSQWLEMEYGKYKKMEIQ